MKILKLVLAGILSTGSVFAHGLWVNSFESVSHGGKLVTVGLGRGHHLTIDDSVPGRMKLQSFDLIGPKGNIIPLKKPSKNLEDIYDQDSLKIVESNFAMQTISLGKKSPKGTYCTALVTKPKKIIRYIDTHDKVKFSIKPKEEIKNLKKVLSNGKNTTYAKSYFVNQSWSDVKAVGHRLELVPTNDISKLYIGDKIIFQVLYNGKPLESGYVTAKSALNKEDNELFSKIRKGKVSFVLTNYGQWMFTVNHKQDVDGITLSDTASVTVNIQ